MSEAVTTAGPVPLAKRQISFGSGKKAARVSPFKQKELIHMFRGLSSMLRAQINTTDALKYYGQGLPNKVLVDTLEKLQRDCEAGISIHEAFKRTGKFDDMTIGLIQAGSESGQLHRAFSELASRLKAQAHFTKQLKKATLVPSFVIAVLLAAFVFSQVQIVPQVEAMLKGVNQSPDGLTAVAFRVSHFTQAVWPVAALSLIATIIIIWRSSHVRNVILNLAMSKWRLLSQLVMSLRQMMFLSTMELLYSNGINLAKAIRVGAQSVKKTPLYDEAIKAADQYEHSGVPLSLAFSKYTSMDDQVVHMLSIGERSASIDSQLKMLSEMYEEESENHMENFTQLVSFLVLVTAVSLIAAVFTGTFLPIFLMGPKMMQSGI
jgi:type II secretory pathway component PulF